MRGVSLKTDWSRETRAKLKLLDPDPNQTRVTLYFSVLNKIDLLIKQITGITQVHATSNS